MWRLQLWIGLCWLSALGFLIEPVTAQSLFQPMSLEQRGEEFDSLQQEAIWIERFNRQLKRVSDFVRPTVVHIEAHKVTSRRTIDEAGSGVIVRIDDARYVLTNRHVIKDADAEKITVRLSNGRLLQPAEVWADRATDIAVMRMASKELLVAKLGNSDSVEVGDLVLAAGSPFGLSHSITMGIISAKGRRNLKLGVEGVQYQNFLQTDVAINPGNSGGPLVNVRGEVIGLNTAIASNSGGNDGIGFSIPINIVIDIARQLVHNGRVTRAFLGVRLDSDFDLVMAQELGLTRRIGARISRIEPESAASKSDLQIGDIILKYDGFAIDDDKHLVNQVKLTPLGKRVEVQVMRNRKSMSIRVQMGNQTDQVEPVADPS